MNPLNVKNTNESLINMNIPRLEKGYQLTGEVMIVSDKMALVRSQSDPTKLYEVNFVNEDCNCPDNQYRHVKCKHLRGVESFLRMKK